MCAEQLIKNIFNGRGDIVCYVFSLDLKLSKDMADLGKTMLFHSCNRKKHDWEASTRQASG